MDEVEIVGYGKQKKVSIVGSIQSIKPTEMRIPTASITNSLAGRLAGAIAVQRTGAPGADGSTFFIRGISTYSGAANPLILLDGVKISSGDLNALSPEIIESVSVLKDATATAIYGTRGANGVLIITTKLGKDSDKPTVSVRIQDQISKPTSVPKFVSGVRYMELFNEAVRGRSPGEILYSKEKIEGTREHLNPYLFPDVNWYNELFKERTSNQEVNVNIQGGGKRVGYFMSVTANESNGLMKKFSLNSYDNNIKLKRYVFQNNINANITPTTKIALRLNTQLRYYHGPASGDQGTYANVMNVNPVDFPMFYPLDSATDRRDVKFGGRSGGAVNDGFPNPFAEMVRGYNDNFQSMMLATLEGEQKLNFITPGLVVKGIVSFKNFSNTNVQRASGYNQFEIGSLKQRPDGSYDFDLNMVGQPQGLSLATSTGTSGDREIYLQPSIEYSRGFMAHNVSGLLLYNQTDFNVNNPDGLISSLPSRRHGYSGRVTYSYDNKYLFEANFGYNGSENFAKGHRYGFFPSVGLGYVLSNEEFFQPLRKTFNLFKIRGSWGKAGNDVIGGNRFPYLADINLGGRGFTTGREQNNDYSGPTYLQFGNPLITWEISEDINIGLDLGILNKFNLVVDIYQRHRTNIFDDLSATIPTSLGTAGTKVFGNVGEVDTKGIDISLDYSTAFSKDFNMSMRGTFTYSKNKILKNNEPAFTKYKNLSAIGAPINSLWGYMAERLFIDQAEIDRSPVQQLGGFVAPGDIKYTNITYPIDGMNIINSDDRVRMGFPTTPEIVYGLSTSFSYKALDFSFLLQGIARTSFFVNGFHPFGSQGLRSVLTFIDDNHWSTSNPDIYAAYPRLSKVDNPNTTANSNFWLRDGSFLKLRSAEIGYTYKFGRIFLSGYNLLTFSEFKLWDPEQGGGNGLQYPTQQVFNLGVQLKFN